MADENNKCEMISDDDHCIYWKKSIKHAAKIEDFFPKKNKKLTLYKLKQKVYDQAAEENYGVTHYGCSPEDFLLSEVQHIFFIWTVQLQKV